MTQNAINIDPSRYNADLLGGEKTQGKEIRNLVKGTYTLSIIETGFKETRDAGDGYTVLFNIEKSDNGETGQRDFMQLLGLTKVDKERRANDITYMLRAFGVPEAEMKAVYVGSIQNPKALAGAKVDAVVEDETYFSKKHQKNVTRAKVKFHRHSA